MIVVRVPIYSICFHLYRWRPCCVEWTCSKGLFTRNVIVTVSVKVTIKVWHCAKDDRHFEMWSGLYAYSVHQHVHQKRSKVPLTKMVTLTVRVNEVFNESTMRVNEYRIWFFSHRRAVKQQREKRQKKCKWKKLFCRHCKIGRLLFHRSFLSIRLGWFSLKLLSNWVQLSHTHAHAFSISCFFYSHFPTFPHNETVELGRHVYGVLNLLLYIVYLCYSNSIVFMFI